MGAIDPIFFLRQALVAYHFGDLQELYSDNRHIHTKCQLQSLHPQNSQISNASMIFNSLSK